MAYVHPVYHGGKNYPEQVTDEFLTCFLCKEPGFKSPRILLCGHTFCLPCLEAYMGTIGLPLQGVSCLPCPLCGKETRIPTTGPSGLRKNIFVDNQIDRLLRRHNKHRMRDDTLYNISDYSQGEWGHAAFNH